LTSSHLNAKSSLQRRPVPRAAITAVRHGSCSFAIRAWISAQFNIRGSFCLRLTPFTLTELTGFAPRSISPQRIAQLKTTAITLRMLPLVLGARASDFNHCSTAKDAPLLVSLRLVLWIPLSALGCRQRPARFRVNPSAGTPASLANEFSTLKHDEPHHRGAQTQTFGKAPQGLGRGPCTDVLCCT
jgi:hypothetical protein